MECVQYYVFCWADGGVLLLLELLLLLLLVLDEEFGVGVVEPSLPLGVDDIRGGLEEWCRC